jgi:YhcH/YjgK/YiaL family protein
MERGAHPPGKAKRNMSARVPGRKETTMIVTNLTNIARQVKETPSLKKAIDFLRKPGLQKLPDGKIEINGDHVFAMVQRYDTQVYDEPKFEAHRKYLDVQFIVSGEEIIGWAPLESMTITEAYNADKDICFGTVAKEKWTPVYLRAGELMVLWPEDAHAPKLAGRKSSPVMKIVVKVAV